MVVSSAAASTASRTQAPVIRPGAFSLDQAAALPVALGPVPGPVPVANGREVR